MSFFGLNVIGSAIDAFQQAADTTSDNIANVNTPGASRKIVNLNQATPIVGSPGFSTWTGPGTKGSGVVVDSITRIHQDSYDGLFRGASSAQSYFDVQQQQLGAVQSAFGEPGSGINTAFTNLQTALSQLASNPTGNSERGGVISSAQAFVTALNNVGNAVTSSKATVVQQATGVVDQANTLIDKIAALNGQIRASKAVGDNPNTYQDQRDLLVDQLSTLLSTQTAIQANGSALVTVGGRALVNDTQAYHLASPVIGTDASGNATLVVGFQGDPNPSNPKPVQLGSGQLAGYADVYNKSLTVYGRNLDAFANATATEIDRITTAGYDANGNRGTALLQSAVAGQAVTAGNIKVGVTDPSQIVAAFASTSAGSLMTGMNAANNVVNTAAAIAGNATFAHPGAAAPTTGTLTVTADGAAQTFAYDFGPGGNAATVDAFVTNFNNAQLGVSAKFDSVAQKMVFSRDPANAGAAHRALQGSNPTSPAFTIGDSNAAAGGSAGTPTSSLLEIVGGAAIDNVAQNGANAYGSGDNAAANALLKLFSKSVGIAGLQTTTPTAIAGGGPVTVAPPASDPAAFAQIDVGQQLTIGAGTANQENVVVTAVDRTTGSITFTAAQAHAANVAIATTPATTLGAYYGSLVARLGLDVRTAATGSTAQTQLAANIDKVRQGIDGINLDEETQNLIRFQNSYQAAARTMNVLDQLLQTAIGLVK